MIEPTDEMVRAFIRAYSDADDGSVAVILEDKAEKAGISAVLAIVERDYRLTPATADAPAERCPKCHGVPGAPGWPIAHRLGNDCPELAGMVNAPPNSGGDL